MVSLSLVKIVLKRMQSRWGLTLLSVMGIALTIGLVVSIPLFAESVGFRILQKELARYAFGNANPLLAMRYYRVPSSPEPMTVQEALDLGKWLGQLTRQEVGLPVGRTYMQIGSDAFILRALPEDSRYKKKALEQVRVNCIPGVEKHIEIIEGLPFEEADKADTLLLWARPEFLAKLGIQIGEEFELFNYNAFHPDKPLRFRVAGTWRAKDPQGAFWYRDPHELLQREFLTTVGAFARFVAPYTPRHVDYSFWYYVLDEKRLRFDEVDRYAKGVKLAQYKAEAMVPSIRVDRSPIEPLQEVQSRTRVLRLLLFGFSLPIIVLALFFVASIAAVAVRFQQAELAILMSRGASQSQVLWLSALEGLGHIALATPLGILASLGFAQAMTLNSSFLAFDRRDPLSLATQAIDLRLALLAGLVSLFARLLPVLKGTRRTIVTYAQQKARATKGDVFQQLLLGLVLVGASVYAYHQLRVRGTMGLINWEKETKAITSDPLVFFAPTLFIFTAAWLIAQIFPLLMRLPDLLGGFLPGTSLYLGLKNLARESGPYKVPLFLVMVCLCLGAFEASVALSADVWLIDRFRYKVGADFSFDQGTMPTTGGEVIGQDAWLLPAEQYRKLPGVLDATRVGNFTAKPKLKTLPELRLMGIDRLDFPRVAYFRSDYARSSLGDLMNRLGTNFDGILVPREILEQTSLALGDTLILDVYVDVYVQTIKFTIVGTFDYFPTMYKNKSLVMVCNLDYIFDQCGGIYPHSIWLRIDPNLDTDTLVQEIKGMGVLPTHELNVYEMIAESKDRLERVGIFGNLSVGFLAGSILACLGILIYTFASLTSRVRRFTILRAIGLGLHQLLSTVSVEYLGVILYGILVGAAMGIATSKLFVPYFQFTQDPGMQVPPFTPLIAWDQTGWIVITYLIVLALAEFVVLARATRREVFQALRLGDEE